MGTTPLSSDLARGLRLFDRQPPRSAHGEGESLRGSAGDDADPRLRAALKRLDRFLASGEPPRANAPRGTYLNITL